MPRKRPSHAIRQLLVEELERRVLPAAEGQALLVDPGLAHPPSPGAAHLDRLDDAASLAAANRHEIAFVDAGVEHWQALVDDLRGRTSNGSLEVVVLDPSRDGIDQISEALRQRSGIDAVHLIGHGSEGVARLGNAQLDAASLDARGTAIAAWGDALSPDADLLLYGCNVAASGSGTALLERLAQLTGADVSASNDPTGSASLGGDWILESHVGPIETSVAVDARAQADWNGLLTLNPTGGETPVNTTTTGIQQTTATGGGNVAADASGSHVVVWEDTRSGTSDVFARLYDAAGAARGPEFRVNTYTTGDQTGARVAMDAGGNFAVVWTSAAQDGSAGGVYAQRFDAAGVAQGGEFRVNASTAGNQGSASIGMDATGNFVVAFTDDNATSGDVYAQRYDASGVAQGANFRANTTTTRGQLHPSVAMGPTGNFVVTWESDRQDNPSTWGIYGQRYDASGVAQGAEFRVNTTVANDQTSSRVATAADGRFVVVWESDKQDTVNSFGMYGQRYDASGVAQGAEFRINTTTAGDQHFGALGMNANGDFVVAWRSSGQDGGGEGIYAQQFDGGGTKIGGEVRVNTTTAGDQIDPSIAYVGDTAVIAWSGNGAGDADGVFVQRYALPLTHVLTVDTASDVADGVTTSTDALLANKGADGVISLREAILAANHTAGADTIGFDIPGAGLHVINLGSALPTITGTVTIDGSTEPGFAGNPVVVLDGSAAGANANGLLLRASDSTIRGLRIQNFVNGTSAVTGAGIVIDGTTGAGDRNTIVGNYLTGNCESVTGAVGAIVVTGAADGNLITSNQLVDNNSDSIRFADALSTGNQITNNVITGSGDDGVKLVGANITFTGNTVAGIQRLTATAAGVELDTVTGASVISGNTITSDGAHGPEGGIWILGSTGISVANNTVSGFTGPGIAINPTSTGIAVTQNSVFSNGKNGIDLFPVPPVTDPASGITANDVNDPDLGGNDLQNDPVLASVASDGSQVTIAGSLNSQASGTYRIEFFANAANDSEGQRYLGFTTVTTPAGTPYTVAFKVTLDAPVAVGEFVTATATSASNDTSEFSAPLGASNGMAIWTNNTNAPQHAQWDGSGFGPASAPNSLGEWENIQTAESLTRTEIIAVGADAAGVLRGEMWDGSAWIPFAFNDVATVSTTGYTSFQVAYEQQSGDAMLVWDNGSAGSASLSYRTWNGTSWSAAQTITTPASGEVVQMRLAADPNSDSMVLAFNGTPGSDKYAMVWNGSSWGNAITLDTTSGAGVERTDISAAYESHTGRALVVYDADVVTNAVAYRIWDGTSWSAQLSVAAPAGVGAASDVNVAVLASDPNSNRIALGVVTDSETWLAVWDGSAWASEVTATAANGSTSQLNVALAFEHDSGDLLAAYGRSGSDFVAYRTWTAAGGWSAETASDANLNLGNTPTVLTLTADPNSDQIMLATRDASGFAVTEDVRYALWTGTTWAAPLPDATSDTGGDYARPMAFVWYDNNRTPVLTSGGSFAIAEGATAVGTIAAGDADGDTPAYAIGGGADQALFAIDAVTGALRFVAAPDFEAPADAGGDNVYDVTIRVADGRGGTDSQAIAVTVTNANESPVAVANLATSPEDTVASGNVLANDTDPDAGDTKTVTQFSVAGAPTLYAPGNTATIPGVGTLRIDADGSYSFTPVADSNGPVPVATYAMRDTAGLGASSTLSITVSAVNDAPVDTLPASFTGSTSAPIALSGLSVADVDALAGTLTTTLSVSSGTLSAASGGGVTVTGSGTSSLTLSGTLANVDAFLVSSPPTFASSTGGAITLTMLTNDGGNTGGGALTDSDTATIQVDRTPIVDLDSGPTTVTSGPVVSTATSTTNLVTGGGFGTVAAATPALPWTESGAAANGSVVLGAALDGRYDWIAPGTTISQPLTVPPNSSNTTVSTTSTANSTTVVTTTVDTADAVTSISFRVAWQNADTFGANDDRLVVSYNGTTYATFNTFQGGALNAAGLAGTWTYSGGASGPATTASVTDEATGALTLVTIDLPAGVTASGTLRLFYTNGSTGAGTDALAIDDVAVTSTKTTTTTVTTVTTTADTAANDWSATYTEQGPAVSIADLDSSIFDGDSANMTSAAITLTNPAIGDRLLVGGSAAASGTLPSGIAWTRTDTAVTLLGAFPKTAYADAIESVQFENQTDTPAVAPRTIRVTVSDGSSDSAPAFATIAVTPVNDAPTATIAPASYAATEQTALALQGTGLSVADVDAGASSVTATVSVASGTLNATAAGTGVSVGGSGTSSVTLTGTLQQINDLLAGNLSGTLGYLHTSDAPPATDTLTLTVDDGGNSGSGGARTGSDSAVIVLTAVNDAPLVSAATFALPENSAIGTAVGTVVSSDPDVTDTRSFAITAGNAGGAFAIDPTTGAITVANAAALDFETTPTFALTVQATDAGGLTGTATVTVNLSNANEAPAVTAATFALPENSANATPVGTVVSSDPDAGDTRSFAITAGNTGGAFVVDPTTGAITVANAAALDFETTPTFAFTVQATDAGGLTGTATVTVNLSNANEAPAVTSATFALPENSASGTGVGIVAASDPDAGDTRSFAITAGNTGGAFAIDPVTGAITVANAAALDFETTPTFALTVQATDAGGLTGTATVTVNLSNANEAPAVTAATFALPENSANATPVGTVVSSDPDAGDTRSFAITAGNTGGAFAIDPVTGAITVANAAALDFETTPTFALTVQATDAGGLTGTATVTVNLSNANEAPAVTSANFALPENSASGTGVGTVAASDPDAGDTRSFAITAGNTGGAFAIDPVTGAITVANAAALDFETTPTFALTVQATDAGGLTGTATVTVNLSNANEAPAVTSANFALPENSASGTGVGTVAASDPDAGDTRSFAITAGNTGGAFTIDPTTGAITVANAAALDFETTPTFALTVQATDAGGLTGAATMTVNLTNANEAPTVTGATFALPENSANGTAVGAVTSSDPDAGDTRSFAITAGNTGGAFTIDPTTGAITVANAAALDFEAAPTFALTVQATDASGATGASVVTLNLTNVNEAPWVNGARFSVAEDLANGSPVGTVTATDPDAADTRSFAITAGNVGGAFAIDPVTGAITIANASALDAAVTPSFRLTVEVTDAGGLRQSAPVEVDVQAVAAPRVDVFELGSDSTPSPPPIEPVAPPPSAPATIPGAELNQQVATIPELILPPARGGTSIHFDVAMPDTSRVRLPSVVESPELRREPQRAQLQKAGQIDQQRLLEALERLRDDLGGSRQGATQEKLAFSIEGVTLLVSGGLLAALARGGSLAAAALSSLPLWRRVDPLAVLALSEEERWQREQEMRAAQRDESIGRLLDEGDDESEDTRRDSAK